jgi:hypothetical protein
MACCYYIYRLLEVAITHTGDFTMEEIQEGFFLLIGPVGSFLVTLLGLKHTFKIKQIYV